MKLNKEELLVGFIYGASCYPLLSFFAIIPAIICSILWAIGGYKYKMVRRLGVPITIGVSLSFTSQWLLLLILPLWGVFSIGYGMPDETDKGSALGRFYSKFLSPKAANWATRFTVFALFNIVIISGLAIKEF